MAVNLSKGQKISLDKGMTLALVGLGWDTNRYSGGAEFDLDASAFLLGANQPRFCSTSSQPRPTMIRLSPGSPGFTSEIFCPFCRFTDMLFPP